MLWVSAFLMMGGAGQERPLPLSTNASRPAAAGIKHGRRCAGQACGSVGGAHRVDTPAQVSSKPRLDELHERLERRLGVGALGLEMERRAGAGGEHHQAQDRGARRRSCRPLSTLMSAAKASAALTNLAAARACRPRRLTISDIGRVPLRRHGRSQSLSTTSSWLATLMYLRPASLAAATAPRQRLLVADRGELDQHRQVHAGHDLDARAIHRRDGEIGRRAAEHVGQDDHARARIDLAHGIHDLGAPLLDIVLGADADRAGSGSAGPTTCSSAAMNSAARRPWVTRTSPIISCSAGRRWLGRAAGRDGWSPHSQPRWPAAACASSSVTNTERCLPPVQPTAIVR